MNRTKNLIRSIVWRKKREVSRGEDWKQKLVTYNRSRQPLTKAKAAPANISGRHRMAPQDKGHELCEGGDVMYSATHPSSP